MTQGLGDVAKHRLLMALDLHDEGVAMMRLTLKRRHPTEDGDQIERRLQDWLHTRPGAEHGDAAGTPVALPYDPAR